MAKFVSFEAIKKDFDTAMAGMGYVRAKVKCEEWGISLDKLNRLFKKGYTCDSFIVNNVRYISVKAQRPVED